MLEREGVKEGRGDAQGDSLSNEDNNDGFESHENGDSSADEVSTIGVQKRGREETRLELV